MPGNWTRRSYWRAPGWREHERNLAKYVRQQRQEQAAFRAKLPGVYALWKQRLGSKCRSLVEAEVGRLG